MPTFYRPAKVTVTEGHSGGTILLLIVLFAVISAVVRAVAPAVREALPAVREALSITLDIGLAASGASLGCLAHVLWRNRRATWQRAELPAQAPARAALQSVRVPVQPVQTEAPAPISAPAAPRQIEAPRLRLAASLQAPELAEAPETRADLGHCEGQR